LIREPTLLDTYGRRLVRRLIAGDDTPASSFIYDTVAPGTFTPREWGRVLAWLGKLPHTLNDLINEGVVYVAKEKKPAKKEKPKNKAARKRRAKSKAQKVDRDVSGRGRHGGLRRKNTRSTTKRSKKSKASFV
jgi:hypothetical protein